jgi:hypothetical protein
MAQHPDKNDSDEILARADAFLARHRSEGAARPAHQAPPAAATTPAPDQSVPDDTAGIPTLTDIVVFTEPTDTAAASGVESEPAPEAALEPVPQAEVISRVQSQNLEHSVYQKLRKGLDEQIAGVIQQNFMPEIGNALDQALQKITHDLHTNIGAMVRASIQENLQLQMKDLRLALESKAAQANEALPASGIMPAFPPTPPSPTSHMELAKSVEPAAIEAHWYPGWESNG